MSLKTLVKVSHLSNLSDARYCAGMGVQLLGFRVIPGTQHYLAPDVFQDIRGWLAGPEIVAELYGVRSVEEIKIAHETYAPDYFELTRAEYEKFADELPLPCIVDVSDGTLPLTTGNAPIAWFITDSPHTYGIDGTTPLIGRINEVEQLEQALSARYSGVAIPGPVESRPGITNTDALGDILEALEED
jgi:phosphoribosylanthranilate isomerase